MQTQSVYEVQTAQTLIYLFRMYERLKVFAVKQRYFFSVDYDDDISYRARGTTFSISVFSQAWNLDGIAVICPVKCSPYVTLLDPSLLLLYLWLIFLVQTEVSWCLYLILPHPLGGNAKKLSV